tara:strand:- start:2215 stop:3417 length:1203 start_codon:yes stop_codon:yes gene_type:complete
MFKYTTAIKKLRKLKARKKVIQGGTSSGKTYGIIPIEIDYCIKHPKTLTTFVAESIPAVRAGCVKIFKDVMEDTGRWNRERWLGNPMQYTFANGSVIEFRSFPTLGAAKAAGKRDRLFLNEANHIDFLIADALMIRSKDTWIDFNPDSEFWAHTEVLPDHNSEFLLLTYHDNEALPIETLEDLLIKETKAFHDVNKDWKAPDNIKNEYWANWCYVYILGEIGNLQGTIFTSWKQIDSLPPEARLIGYGMDFGYTNDPTTLVAAYKYNDQIIWDEVIYQKGLLNSAIASLMESNEVKLTTYADSAEPKSIAELRSYGLMVVATQKGADSIMYGVGIMQELDMVVTSRSVNVINELRHYVWATDKSGASMNKPIDNYNHAIDAMRYFCLSHFTNKSSGEYYY